MDHSNVYDAKRILNKLLNANFDDLRMYNIISAEGNIPIVFENKLKEDDQNFLLLQLSIKGDMAQIISYNSEKIQS